MILHAEQSDRRLGFQLIKSDLSNLPNINVIRSHVSPVDVLYHALHEAVAPAASDAVGVAVTVGMGTDDELKLATQ